MKDLNFGLSVLLLFLSSYGIIVFIKVLNVFSALALLFSIIIFIRNSIYIFKYLKFK